MEGTRSGLDLRSPRGWLCAGFCSRGERLVFAHCGHDILTQQQRLCSERTADVVIVQSGAEQRKLARRLPQAGDVRRLQEIDGDLDAYTEECQYDQMYNS